MNSKLVARYALERKCGRLPLLLVIPAMVSKCPTNILSCIPDLGRVI